MRYTGGDGAALEAVVKEESFEHEFLQSVLSSTEGLDPETFAWLDLEGYRKKAEITWKPPGAKKGTRRFLIVDPEPDTIESPTARMSHARGYNTAHDVAISADIEQARQHNIIVPYAYGNFQHEGETHTWLAQEFIEDAISLGKLIEKRKEHQEISPLKRRFGTYESLLSHNELFKIVEGAAQKLNHVHRQGILFRDLNLGSILLTEQAGIITNDYLVDRGSAIHRSEADPKFRPTAGPRNISDPFIFAEFTGEERAYDEKADLYQLGSIVYQAITGEPLFEFDPHPGRKMARTYAKKADLLGADGRIDTQEYDKQLKKGIKRLPRWARKQWGPVLEKMLASDRQSRFYGATDLLKGIHGQNPLKQERKSTLIQAIGMTSLAWSLITAVTYVHASYDPVNELPAGGLDSGKIRAHSLTVENEKGISVDDKSYIARAEPGDTLKFKVHAEHGNKFSRAIGDRAVPFPGKAYLEGTASESDFIVTATNEDSARAYQDVQIIIPKDIRKGNHLLTFETYAPKEGSDPEAELQMYTRAGITLAEERVPVLIGMPEETHALYPARIEFMHTGDRGVLGTREGILFAVKGPDRYTYANETLGMRIRIPGTDFRTDLPRVMEPGTALAAVDIPHDLPPGGYVFHIQAYDRTKEEKPIVGEWFMPANRVGENSWGKLPYELWQSETRDDMRAAKLRAYAEREARR